MGLGASMNMYVILVNDAMPPMKYTAYTKKDSKTVPVKNAKSAFCLKLAASPYIRSISLAIKYIRIKQYPNENSIRIICIVPEYANSENMSHSLSDYQKFTLFAFHDENKT